MTTPNGSIPVKRVTQVLTLPGPRSKLLLVLTPAWTAGYSNSFTDLCSLPFLTYLSSLFFLRTQELPRRSDGDI